MLQKSTKEHPQRSADSASVRQRGACWNFLKLDGKPKPVHSRKWLAEKRETFRKLTTACSAWKIPRDIVTRPVNRIIMIDGEKEPSPWRSIRVTYAARPTSKIVSFPYHRCRNSNSSSLIKIKETSREEVWLRVALRAEPTFILPGPTIAWDYGPFVHHFHRHLHTHPFHLRVPFHREHAFFSSSRLRPRDRVISGRNVRLSWVLIFFFFLRDA